MHLYILSLRLYAQCMWTMPAVWCSLSKCHGFVSCWCLCSVKKVKLDIQVPYRYTSAAG